MRAAVMLMLLLATCGPSASDACRDLNERICEASQACGESCPTMGGPDCAVYDELSCDWAAFFECQGQQYCGADGFAHDRNEPGACDALLGDDPGACWTESFEGP